MIWLGSVKESDYQKNKYILIKTGDSDILNTNYYEKD